MGNQPTKNIGESCTDASECIGYTLGIAPGNFCCSGVCKEKVPDCIKAHYCPEEATCQKEIGEPCIAHTECKGYTLTAADAGGWEDISEAVFAANKKTAEQAKDIVM